MIDLRWRQHGADWALYDRRRIVGRVVPDAKWPGMWRVRLPGGLSDMVNLSRAKDAALALAEQRGDQARRAAKSAKKVVKDQRSLSRTASPMRRNDVPATPLATTPTLASASPHTGPQ